MSAVGSSGRRCKRGGLLPGATGWRWCRLPQGGERKPGPGGAGCSARPRPSVPSSSSPPPVPAERLPGPGPANADRFSDARTRARDAAAATERISREIGGCMLYRLA
jgi:hypothetical protein